MNDKTESIAELKEVVAFAKKHGLKRLSINTRSGAFVEIEFSSQSPRKRSRTAPGEAKNIEEQSPEYSDDQVLNWSSGDDE